MWTQLGYNTLSNSVAIGALHLSGISDKVNLGNNMVANGFKDGLFLSTAEDMTDYWMYNNSLLQQGRFQDFVDRSIFNGLAYTGVKLIEADKTLFNLIDDVSPFPSNINSALTIGGILTVIKTAGETWESTGSDMAIRTMHPTRILFGN